MTKIKLPYTETQLQAQRDLVAELKKQWQEAEEILWEMGRENTRAQDQINLTNSRNYTETRYNWLKTIAVPGARINHFNGFRSESVHVESENKSTRMPNSVFSTFLTAKYIKQIKRSSVYSYDYEITDFGRQTLKEWEEKYNATN